VLRHVAAGFSNAEIGERMFIAPCTVRKHLENAYRKLGVTNRLAAVLALQGGRLPDPGTGADPGHGTGADPGHGTGADPGHDADPGTAPDPVERLERFA
jgi:hypothetical protein